MEPHKNDGIEATSDRVLSTPTLHPAKEPAMQEERGFRHSHRTYSLVGVEKKGL
jgi:hypothetical protein